MSPDLERVALCRTCPMEPSGTLPGHQSHVLQSILYWAASALSCGWAIIFMNVLMEGLDSRLKGLAATAVDTPGWACHSTQLSQEAWQWIPCKHTDVCPLALLDAKPGHNSWRHAGICSRCPRTGTTLEVYQDCPKWPPGRIRQSLVESQLQEVELAVGPQGSLWQGSRH